MITKKTKILFVLIIFILIVFIFYAYTKINKKKFVEINNNHILIDIADTPQKKYIGLSGRQKICNNCGMLFIFGQNNNPVFVMRNMNFSLDIIWIKKNKIVKIDDNLSPEGNIIQNYFTSDIATDYILEVNGGFTKKNNIKVNNTVNINL